MKRLFPLLLLMPLCFAVTLMASLLAVQVAYAGPAVIERALADEGVRSAIGLSFFVAGVATILATLLAVPVAYVLARWKFRGKAAVETLLVIPVLMSPMALGVALVLLFLTEPGRWVQSRWMQFVFELPGMVLAQFVVALALEILVLRAVFEGVDPQYERVARFLGCSAWEVFHLITLPLARRGIVAAAILGWTRAMGEFGATAMIAGAVAGKTETVPIAIHLRMSSADLPQAVALSVLLTLVALASVIATRSLQGEASNPRRI